MYGFERVRIHCFDSIVPSPFHLNPRTPWSFADIAYSVNVCRNHYSPCLILSHHEPHSLQISSILATDRTHANPSETHNHRYHYVPSMIYFSNQRSLMQCSPLSSGLHLTSRSTLISRQERGDEGTLPETTYSRPD